MLVERPLYLERITSYRNTFGIIKIITGIRRSGKSTLLKLYQNYLLKNGVKPEQIIDVNFESIENDFLLDYRRLYEYVKSKLTAETTYVFFDEIQNVKNFQKVLNSLNIINNVDVYVTGSNAYLLSGELATLLSGRYIQIEMYPLSFKEYFSYFNEIGNEIKLFNDYIKFGSFPYVLSLRDDWQKIDYLESIHNAIVLKDIVQRNRIGDVGRLQKVILFIFNNIGSLTSINNIKNQMTGDNFKIDVATIENYLNALINSFIVYRVPRYDIGGKELLKTNDKYYVADLGLRHLLLRDNIGDLGHILENVVYLELLRRGYRVYVGKKGSSEIDFVAIKNNAVEYYQVSQTVSVKETMERELKTFKTIRDNYPKYLLTMDFLLGGNYDGVECINVLKWLLN
jgi:predicted AAA+ superfamily ATPase